MTYRLVLQWPASSLEDYGAMVELEDALSTALSDGSEVDGHDAGSSEMNIFIDTDEPAREFNAVKPLLAAAGMLSNVRVAYREQTGSHYTIVCPEGLEAFSVK